LFALDAFGSFFGAAYIPPTESAGKAERQKIIIAADRPFVSTFVERPSSKKGWN